MERIFREDPDHKVEKIVRRDGNESIPLIDGGGYGASRRPPATGQLRAEVTALVMLVFLYLFVHNQNNLFIAPEATHATGIAVLIYKLIKNKTCVVAPGTTQQRSTITATASIANAKILWAFCVYLEAVSVTLDAEHSLLRISPLIMYLLLVLLDS